jgi:hypothetical protein
MKSLNNHVASAIDIIDNMYTGWWFGTFGLFFHSVGNNHPN